MIPAHLSFVDVALSLPLETLESLIKNNPDLVYNTGYGGQTALHKAVYIGNYSVSLALLKNGADPNFANETGETCLHVACSKGALKLLVALLSYQGNLNIPNKFGSLPIHCAAHSGSLVVIQFLSEVYNFNLEVSDSSGATVLHAACAGGHLDLVKFLIEFKKLFCLNTDSEGNTILHSAAIGGLSGICWMILSHGGESLLTHKNSRGHTPLAIANNSLNVSKDCKTWLEKWTKEYEKKKKISSPRFRMVFLKTLPLFVVHMLIVLSNFLTPENQWRIGIPGFIFFLIYIRRQEHRISHPSRLANPLFVGCYVAGILSTFTYYLTLFFEDKRGVPDYAYFGSVFAYLIQFYFLLFLIRKDPGRIPRNSYVKDSLMKLAEDRLDGERYCSQCFISAPLASHHCRLCDRCVLHMDHHCLFLNTCIGANNHWHFVILIFLNILTASTFILTCYLQAVVELPANTKNLIHDILGEWLLYDIWLILLLICNCAGLVWTLKLIRYQYNVIGSDQRTVDRIKHGIPHTKISCGRRAKNFLSFLFNRKLTQKKASHYFKA
ncbi:UNVERIFIED_CONTAM: hypothetical protein RMT77_006553 [Armadillidium vulgare]